MADTAVCWMDQDLDQELDQELGQHTAGKT